MADRPYSEYAERNSGPILAVLQTEFASCRRVLEIGSGTGQHAVCFAHAMPGLTWQPSDRHENLGGIASWTEETCLKNLLPPIPLDVLSQDGPDGPWDGVFSANTAHIMSVAAVERMFAMVGCLLASGGVFCLYGPFRQGGTFNTESNAAFHESLRCRDPAMGIRDIEALDEYGNVNELARVRLYAMPANNHLAVWIKGAI